MGKPKIGETRSGENTFATKQELAKLVRNMTRHKPGSGLVIRHARQV